MKKYNQQSGFSLVETLVAITIVLIVIIGPMRIMATAANSANYTNEHVIAFFLAQEGVELAQKARDDLVLQRFITGGNPTPWTTFTNAASGPYANCFRTLPQGCGLEISENANGAIETPRDCSSGGNLANCDLYYNDTAGNIRSRYTYDNSFEDTPYRRTITFEQLPSGYDVRVRSRVEWFSGIYRNAQRVEVETVLFNVYAP